MLHLATFFLPFWHYFYWPSHGPWYAGAIWGNVFVIVVVAPLAWLWSKTKFWPLRPISHGIAHLHTKIDSLHQKHDQQARRMEELHDKMDLLHEKHDALHVTLHAKLEELQSNSVDAAP